MRGVVAFASGTSRGALPPAGNPRSNALPIANDVVTPVAKSSWYRRSGALGLKLPSVDVKARVALLAEGSASTQAKVTGGVANATLEMIRVSVAGVVDMSITATPDCSAMSTDPNDPPQATSTGFVLSRESTPSQLMSGASERLCTTWSVAGSITTMAPTSFP